MMQTEKEMCEKFEIKKAVLEDMAALDAFADSFQHNNQEDYYTRQFEYQAQGKRAMLIGRLGEKIIGYCVLNLYPKYPLFKKLEIPEIQDVVIHPDYRRCGYGKALIGAAEAMAIKNGAEYVGIGVSVSPKFGTAQQLYVKLGYIPDSNGVNYDRKALAHGAFHPIDDDLCLMMVKKLV